MTRLELYRKAIDAHAKTAGRNTQYTISEDGDTVYLAIEGSCDKDDWRFNFNFWVAPYKRMPVKWYTHRGFAKAWKLARGQIASEVMGVLAGRKLVCLGYSHGAALALLAHEYFTFHGVQVETHVFGCPRVLWLPRKIIRERFGNCWLYQARGDIVTMVPFWWLGYRHVGHTTHCGPCRFPSHIPHLDYEETLEETI